jgi:hypothetical protein
MQMWEPISIVFGVRHKKRFAFLDYSGEVLDSVIEMQEAGELPGDVEFEQVGWQKVGARLQDAKGGVSVTFDVEGLVLTVDLNRSPLHRGAAKRLFLALVPKVLRTTGGDAGVNRIGTLENYRFDHRASGQAAVSALTNLESLGTATDIAMRVAFRSPTNEQGLMGRDIGDWRNTIIQVWNRRGEESEADQAHLDVSIDYQTYFIPERPYFPYLVENHDREFTERLEALQSGQLARLIGEQVAQ